LAFAYPLVRCRPADGCISALAPEPAGNRCHSYKDLDFEVIDEAEFRRSVTLQAMRWPFNPPRLGPIA
jgi:hypothetical protein